MLQKNQLKERGLELEPLFWNIITEAATRMWVTINFDFITQNYSEEIVSDLVSCLRNYHSYDVSKFVQKGLGIHNAVFVTSNEVRTNHHGEKLHEKSILQEKFFYPTLKIKKEFDKNSNSFYKELDLYIPKSFRKSAIAGFDTSDELFEFHNVNYFVKYLWHTYCHNILQDINDTNFKLFKGAARIDSDFYADSVANYMLPLSYGIPVVGCGHKHIKGDDKKRLKRIIFELFKENRCNQIFVNREFKRPVSNKNSDIEFRYKRNLTNYLSARMLASGFNLEEVKVYLSDSGNVVILRVNGRYIYTEYSPKIENNLINPSLSANEEVFNYISEFLESILRQDLEKYMRENKNHNYMKKIKDTIDNVVIKITSSKTLYKTITSKNNLILADIPISNRPLLSDKKAA